MTIQENAYAELKEHTEKVIHLVGLTELEVINIMTCIEFCKGNKIIHPDNNKLLDDDINKLYEKLAEKTDV